MDVLIQSKACYLALIILFLVVADVRCYTTSSADSLYTALTFGYNNLVRPSGTTSVTVSFGILSVNYLDVKSQTFSVTGWMDASWSDSRFSWTPGSYSGIDEMYLDYTNCWNPKIVVDNSANDASILADGALLFKINDAGSVVWSPFGDFTVHCTMDVTYYPYDVQTCFISLKSWSFKSAYVSFVAGSIYTNQYVENDEWEMTSTSVTSQDVSVNSVAFSNLQFAFKMTRRSSTFLIMVVMPLVIVSFLGMWVFIIPAECSCKLGFALAVLIAQIIMLGSVLDVTPTSAKKVPILGTYLLILIVIGVLEIFLTVVILKLYHNKDRQRRVTERYERFAATCYALSCYKYEESATGSATSPSNETNSTCLDTPHTNESPPEFKNSIKRRLSLKTISPDNSFAHSSKDEFRNARERPRAWSDGGALCGGRVDRKYTWEQVSAAADRLCFIIFLFIRLILAVIFLTIISVGSS